MKSRRKIGTQNVSCAPEKRINRLKRKFFSLIKREACFKNCVNFISAIKNYA